MSSMMHKVKDALSKPSHEHGHDGYNTTSGAHTQSSMPGAFDGTTDHTTTSGHHGTTGQGLSSTTSPTYDSSGRATHGTGLGHSATHGTSKYGAEPSQPSYAQDHARTNHGTALGGTGATTGAGNRTSGVPASVVMDPADSGSGANVMDRARGDYHDTPGSGPNVLHKKDDHRTNYDNSARSAREDQAAVLRQQQGGEPVHNSNLANKLDPRVDSTRHPEVSTTTATTTSTTGYGHGQTDRNSREYGNTTSGSGYGQTDRTSREPVHNSNIANKLDPRVDSTRQGDYNTTTGASGYNNNNTTTSGYDRSDKYDRTDKDSRDQPVHNSNLLNKLDPRVDSTKTTDYDNNNNNRDTYGTTDRKPALPARPRDQYDSTTSGNYSSRNPDPYTTTSSTTGNNPLYRSTNDRSTNDYADNDHSNKPSLLNRIAGGNNTGHDSTSSSVTGGRTHFHCMYCGHKNDVGHLTDARGFKISGRTAFHCMDCGHKNEVGHLLKSH